MQWCNQNDTRWAFSDRNAGTYYARFFKHLEDLQLIDWQAVSSTNFTDSQVKEGKQAEFLVYEFFPWEMVEQIGVINGEMQKKVQNTLRHASHKPPVSVEPLWYF